MKPKDGFVKDDAGPYKGVGMHVSSKKVKMVNPLKCGSEIGADTCSHGVVTASSSAAAAARGGSF